VYPRVDAREIRSKIGGRVDGREAPAGSVEGAPLPGSTTLAATAADLRQVDRDAAPGRPQARRWSRAPGRPATAADLRQVDRGPAPGRPRARRWSRAPGRSAPGRSVAAHQPTSRLNRGLFICSFGRDHGGLRYAIDARLGRSGDVGRVTPTHGTRELNSVERSDGFATEHQLAGLFPHSGTIAHRSL
jgi:hypothetical protein